MALLHRINPEQNERRYYLVFTGPALLEKHAVTRFWGRIGGQQRGMVTPCDSAAVAEELARRLVGKRVKRGYKLIEATYTCSAPGAEPEES
jgi:predicted DNA-binding WGR domain protein